MKKILLVFVLMLCILEAKDYTKNRMAIDTIHTLVKKYHFKRAELKKLFRHVRVQKSALRLFLPKKRVKRVKDKRTPSQIAKARKRYRKYGPWERYSRLKINPSRVKQGIAFIQKYKTIFNRVEKQFGVPKEYIAAIIGIETVYGGNVGKYPVFDTLATLAFEKHRRSRFFQKELIKFLHLAKTQRFNPKNVKGSYAGAIGLGQFMPSNYEAYGVDFNGDGRITLQRASDAIASIANYFKKNGWQKGEPVATRVKYKGNRFHRYKTGYKHTYSRQNLRGISPLYHWDYRGKVRLIKLKKKKYDELWYGAKNFFVITRYNHSAYYAMSVHQLAQKIKKGLKK